MFSSYAASTDAYTTLFSNIDLNYMVDLRKKEKLWFSLLQVDDYRRISKFCRKYSISYSAWTN